MKKAALILAAAALAVGGFAKELVVGIFDSAIPPFVQTDANGELSGWEIDLAKILAAKTGRPLKMRRIVFGELFSALQRREIDVVVAMISDTEARRRSFDLSKNYAQGGCAFLYRKNGTVPTMITAERMRIGTVDGVLADIYLCRHGLNPTRYDTCEEGVKDLLAGKLDTFFFDLYGMKKFLDTHPELALSALETRDRYSMVIRKGEQSLLDAANAAVDEFLAGKDLRK